MADKIVFMTGATGFIGSHLTRSLLKQGYRIITLCPQEEPSLFGRILSPIPLCYPTCYSDLKKEDWNLWAVRGDIRDGKLMDELFGICRNLGLRVSMVIHLAACSTIQQAQQNVEEAWEVNVGGTERLLEAVKNNFMLPDGSFDLDGFIYASTDKVYGEGSHVPYEEDHPLAPGFPYEKTKAYADRLVRRFYETCGLPCAVARFCNVYGPGDPHKTRVVPGTLYNLLIAHRPPLIRYYRDGEGHEHGFRRDMIYIDDLVDGLICLMNRMRCYYENPELQRDVPVYGEAFNMGTGHCYEIREIVERIQELAGDGAQPVKELVECGEIHDQCMSFGKAERVFGFTPVTSLEEGIAKTVAWYRNGGIMDDEFTG